MKSNDDQLIESLPTLAADIRPYRDTTEKGRQLAHPVVEALRGHGLFRLWLPKKFGGHECDVSTFIRVIEEVSRIDSAAGWCLTIGGTFSRFGGFLSESATRTIFGDARSSVAGTINPSGRAVPEKGGYRVNGRWAFGSGIDHATWVLGSCIVMDGDGPRFAANGIPEIRIVFFPKTACDVIDTWDVVGLRGTGSQDYVVRDLFVPEEYSILQFGASPTQSGPLYAMPLLAIFAVGIAAVPLGIARAAIDALTELAAVKVPTASMGLLRDRPSAQAAIGRAEALLRSGRAFLFDAVGQMWSEAQSRGEVSLQSRAAVRLACAHSAASCASAVDLAYEAGGATSIRRECTLERCFRDVHTATQHMAIASSNYELGGRVLFGMDPGVFV